MKLQTIKEREIKLSIPVEEKLTKRMDVFYNPEMKFDRDLSEVIVKILKPKKICDLFCASGVRGLRYASVLKNSEVVLNDKNPRVVEFARKNAELNKLNVRIENKDANKLLLEERFDFIDIDPFGSPIYFLDSAAKSIRIGGTVAITATDTAPLCGTSPLTSLRRYGVKSLRTDFSKEIGLRILISASIRNFAKYDLAFKPIFSYYQRHYFRIFGKIERGAGRVNKLLKQFDYLSYCQKCGWRKEGISEKCEFCGNKTNLIQEIYLGNFADKDICNQILKEIGCLTEIDKILPPKIKETGNHLSSLIRRVRDEQDFPLYFDIHKLCKLNKKQPKKMVILLEKLEGKRTHFSETGIKTKKSLGDVLESLS